MVLKYGSEIQNNFWLVVIAVVELILVVVNRIFFKSCIVRKAWLHKGGIFTHHMGPRPVQLSVCVALVD